MVRTIVLHVLRGCCLLLAGTTWAACSAVPSPVPPLPVSLEPTAPPPQCTTLPLPATPDRPTNLPQPSAPPDSTAVPPIPIAFAALDPRVRAALERSPSYQMLQHHGDLVLRVTALPSFQAERLPDVVLFFVAMQRDKANTPIPRASPIGVLLVHTQADVYQTAWTITTDVESPDVDRGVDAFQWFRRHFEAVDLTGDGAPEVLIAGCTGFGNRCTYRAYLWDVAGKVLFTTETDRFGGALFDPVAHTITVRTGLDITGAGEANLVPGRFQLDIFTWSGTAFMKTNRQIIPYNGLDG
jgi:hypothetical protein